MVTHEEGDHRRMVVWVECMLLQVKECQAARKWKRPGKIFF
jgi:hypothetical protein